jgi:hypothetical protein
MKKMRRLQALLQNSTIPLSIIEPSRADKSCMTVFRLESQTARR